MISKDGSEIGVLDRRSGTTRIFRVDPTTGACTQTGDLGIKTGKVNFSFDGRKLTFHAPPLSIGQASNDNSASYTNQAYVYDRDTQRLTPLTHPGLRDESAQYPGFTRDGRVIFQRTIRRGSSSYERSYVVMNPARSRSIPAPLSTSTPACFRDVAQYYDALTALGELWRKTCLIDSSGTAGRARAIPLALNLDPDGCRELVNRYYNQEFIGWLNSQSGISAQTPGILAQLSPALLIAACPAGAQTVQAGAPVVVGQAQQQTSTVPPVIQQKCVGCHMQGSPGGFIPFDNLSALNSRAPTKSSSSEPSLRKEIERRIRAGASGRMPIGGDELTATERQSITNYFGGGAN
jgi:mono/diheme cytochrome c family protein